MCLLLILRGRQFVQMIIRNFRTKQIRDRLVQLITMHGISVTDLRCQVRLPVLFLRARMGSTFGTYDKPEHNYSTPGSKNVVLSVTTNDGCNNSEA